VEARYMIKMDVNKTWRSYGKKKVGLKSFLLGLT